MQNNSAKSRTLIIGIILILAVVLTKRMSIRSFHWESALSFLAGVAVILVFFLVLKVIMKNKK